MFEQKELEEKSYTRLFNGCVSLTNVPLLPDTIVTNKDCYYDIYDMYYISKYGRN